MLFSSFQVFARTGINFNFFALIYKERYLNDSST